MRRTARPAYFAQQRLRRLICVAGVLALLLWALPGAVQAQFDFVTNNGAITITNYTGPGGDVVIPNETNGLPVTSIGGWAFYHCTTVTNVTIPDSVGTIGEYAFCECSSLAKVTIGNSVTSIGNLAFCLCTSLTNVTVPDSVAIVGSQAFSECTSLASVSMGKSVTNLGVYAFIWCPSLSAIMVDPLNAAFTGVDGVLFNKDRTTLIQYPAAKEGNYTIPNSVTRIGSRGFDFCPGLTNLTIPNSVTNVESYAFECCWNLATVIIPESVTGVDGSAFVGCTSLKMITVDALNPSYSSVDGVLFNKAQTRLVSCPGGRVGDYTISNSVTVIAGYAFQFCTNLTSVSIPDSVTNIEMYAFWWCINLTNLVIPDNVISIDLGAFESCTNLTSIKMPNTLTSIQRNSFNDCSSLTNITIPDSVTSIGDFAFYLCTSLRGVCFLGNAPSLGQDVFLGADNSTVYYLPGTTGWGSTFGGRPTALWRPQIQTCDSSFGVRTNQFGFNIVWASGRVIVVEACTNLTSPAWFPLQTNTLSAGSLYFGDPHWTSHPVRFYRLHSP